MNRILCSTLIDAEHFTNVLSFLGGTNILLNLVGVVKFIVGVCILVMKSGKKRRVTYTKRSCIVFEAGCHSANKKCLAIGAKWQSSVFEHI